MVVARRQSRRSNQDENGEIDEAAISRRFGDAFDFPGVKKNEPYRKLVSWFLCKPFQQNESRLTLPENRSSFSSMELHGILCPSPFTDENMKNKQVRVKIKKSRSWEIDPFNPRGVWIAATKAWYQLLDPCTKPIMLKGIEISQQDLHLPFRAKCNLAFDIGDILVGRYFKKHQEFKPSEVHENLSKKEVWLTEHPEDDHVPSEPFDLELLK